MKSVKSKAKKRNKESGFSVVELMMAVAVAAILMASAVPTFSSVVHKNRISVVTTQLYVSLNAARSEALKRRSVVEVCPSSDSLACRTDGDWSDGWLIFEDVNADDAPQLEEIIQLVDGFDGEIGMQASTAFSKYVQFQPTGAVLGNGGNSGEFRLCHLDSNAKSTAITISAAGRVASNGRDQTDCNES